MQCPICGSAKASGGQTAAAGSLQGGEAASSYTYVKGGRFSKSNVRRRNKSKGKAPERRSTPNRQPQKNDKKEEKTNRALVVVVVLLLLAIIAVVIYIGVRLLGPSVNPGHTEPPAQTTLPSGEPVESTVPEVPCTGLELSNTVIELENPGDAWLLFATPTPAETTDKIMMISADESVATVSETGNVVAVGGGETVITVICGTAVAECRVVCSFGEPSQPTLGPTNPIDPVEELKFNTVFRDEATGKYDVMLSKKGETWRAYRGSISLLEITWISDNPNVCTIENGVVTAVGRGTTEVHAQYNGVTVSCIVRCNFPADPEPTEPPASEEPTQPTEPAVSISNTDVTLPVGRSFNLTLKKGTEELTVEWKAEEEGIVTIEGNKITGVTANLVGTKVSTTYEGKTYTCIVRVSG